MRMRTAIVAGALAAVALMGGAGPAMASDTHRGHEAPSGVAGFSDSSERGGAGHYHNLGGPFGITDASFAGFERKRAFDFLSY